MKKIKNRTGLLLIGLVFIPLILFSSSTPAEKSFDLILNAMSHEMKRSLGSLVIEDMEKPYFLEYSIWDCYKTGIDAAFGSLIKSAEDHKRFLKVGLRVGSYKSDNTGFVGSYGMVPLMPGYFTTIILENNYDAIRHDIWLATDKAYKDALAQIAGKKAYLKNYLPTDDLPDFTRERSNRMLLPKRLAYIDKIKWQKTIKELSAIFRKFPLINKSEVKFQVLSCYKYYLNSEGSVFSLPVSIITLSASAAAQAPDGMILKNFVPFCVTDIKDLPGKEILIKKITQMAGELESLVSAPVPAEEYIGPVLFTRQAAAELFIQAFVPHLSGQRPFLSEIPSISRLSRVSKLARRLNRSVLPKFLSVTDNPELLKFKNNKLFGSYRIDEEGVKPTPVKLVERGIFKSLLMTRRPHKKIFKSNGHARAAVLGCNGIQISNLFITAEKGKSYEQLKKELIELCIEQQLKYGIIIKTLDDPGFSGIDSSTTGIYGSGPSNLQLSAPVLMYRIYVKDGREELVRGITVSDFTLRHFRDIYSAGNDPYVYNRLMPTSSNNYYTFFAFSAAGNSGMIGVPVSIVVPSILFDELEFKKLSFSRKSPPILPHPYFAGQQKKK